VFSVVEKKLCRACGDEWRHSRIVLRSATNQTGYNDLVFEEESEGELSVVGEFAVAYE